jgi:inhibitor of cysteine peptidase
MKRPMPHRILPAGAVLVIFILLMGVVTGATATIKRYSAGDSGSMVVIKKGEAFKVILEENPSTGYSWNMSVSDGLEIMNDLYIPPAQQIPGRGGYHEWTIQAEKPGQQKVRGIYMRPWEPIYYNETTFRLDVEVTGSLSQAMFPDLSGNAFNIRNMLGNFGSLDFSPPALHFDLKGLFRF